LFSDQPAHLADSLIVQQRERPVAQISAGLPEMPFSEGAHEGALQKIIGLH
jgi:hypothetical protein